MILILDDDNDVLISLERILKKHNIDYISENCPIRAKELISTKNFKVIISDYQMANINGVEFLTEAKDKSPKSIRILLTAINDLDIFESFKKDETIHIIIEKPFLPTLLINEITKCRNAYMGAEKL